MSSRPSVHRNGVQFGTWTATAALLVAGLTLATPSAPAYPFCGLGGLNPPLCAEGDDVFWCVDQLSQLVVAFLNSLVATLGDEVKDAKCLVTGLARQGWFLVNAHCELNQFGSTYASCSAVGIQIFAVRLLNGSTCAEVRVIGIALPPIQHVGILCP